MKKWLLRALDVALIAVGCWVVWRIVHEYPLHQILAALLSLPPWALVVSAAVTAAGYLALVGYDILSLRMVDHPLPTSKVLAPSFISFAVANSAPVSVLTGGGIRYRLYRGLGLSGRKMAKVAGLDVLTFVLGLFTVAGIAFEASPVGVPPSLAVPVFSTVRPIGLVLLVLVGLFLVLAAWHRRMCILDHQVVLPSIQMAVAEIVVSGFDWLLSSGALYVLLRSVAPIGYGHFLATFLLAQMVTQVVPLPGGIGAFEAIILLLRPSGIAAPPIFAGLVAYRLIYYVLPLLIAGILLATSQRDLLTAPAGEADSEDADRASAALPGSRAMAGAGRTDEARRKPQGQPAPDSAAPACRTAAAGRMITR